MATRDVKGSTRPAAARSRTAGKPKSRSGGNLMTGLMIGLIIGVAVAVGIAMYLNRSGTPFTNLQKLERRGAASEAPPEVLQPGPRIEDAPPVAALPPSSAASANLDTPAPPPATPVTKPVTPAPQKEASGADGQRFDFYKILPGQIDASPEPAKKEPSPAPAAQRWLLQLGAFQHEDEADNLKAKLALLGVEARIQSVELPEKGLIHRVRVGPFGSQEDMERVRAQLKQNGISATVVK